MRESLSSLLSPQRGPSCFEDAPGCPHSCPYHPRRPHAWGPRSTSAPLISPQVAGMLSQRASAQSVRQWRLGVGTWGAQLLLGTEAKHRGVVRCTCHLWELCPRRVGSCQHRQLLLGWALLRQDGSGVHRCLLVLIRSRLWEETRMGSPEN